jgi:prolipoprotein diacylglyceryltransferase
MKEFLKNNLNLYHIIGIILFVAMSVFYWNKAGKFSDNVLQNNLFLMIIWGILVGYILADMVINAMKRKNKEE